MFEKLRSDRSFFRLLRHKKITVGLILSFFGEGWDEGGGGGGGVFNVISFLREGW